MLAIISMVLGLLIKFQFLISIASLRARAPVAYLPLAQTAKQRESEQRLTERPFHHQLHGLNVQLLCYIFGTLRE